MEIETLVKLKWIAAVITVSGALGFVWLLLSNGESGKIPPDSMPLVVSSWLVFAIGMLFNMGLVAQIDYRRGKATLIVFGSQILFIAIFGVMLTVAVSRFI